MKRKGILILFFLAFLLFSPPQGNALITTDSAMPIKPTLRETMRDKKQTIREDLQTTIMMKREEAKKKFQDLRDTFKKRLAEFKDERKKTLVARIDEKMTTINKRRTDHMITVLEKLNNILKKIEDKTNTAKGQGVNTTTVDAAIQAAHDAISAASNAVSAQAGKDYVITIGDETGIKNSVGQAMSGLEKDLRNTHKLVVDAKQAVMKAAKELAKTVGHTMKENKTATEEAPAASGAAQ